MFKGNLPGIVWAFFILILCGIPGRDIPHISFLELLSFDKWVHAALFFVLELLFIRPRLPDISRAQLFLLTTCIIAYGGLLEVFQQLFFSERSADLYDFIANSFGALLGLAFYKKLLRGARTT